MLEHNNHDLWAWLKGNSVMPDDLMRYDLLAQNALRGVVRDALRKVERDGLPGDHHFLIAFHTKHPNVSISETLLKRYPREMTIVLQHQFWGLTVYEDRFCVELSFDNVPEKLVIPFAAVKGFLDPTVQFGLQFEVIVISETAQNSEEISDVDLDDAHEVKQLKTPGRKKSAAGKSLAPDKNNSGKKTTEKTEAPPNVVSLDQFRKK